MYNQEESAESYQLLIVKHLTGEISKEEYIRLNQWMNQSTQNKALYQQMEAAWVLTGRQAESDSSVADRPWNHVLHKISVNFPKRTGPIAVSTKYLKVAASWIIFFLLGSGITYFFLNRQQKLPDYLTEIVAPLGAKSLVSLPDGTTLWLNAGSKITYKRSFGIRNREINLTGEAYFKVTSDKAHPFIVKTSDIIVKALGTRFNVKAYPDEKTITTTLEEGKVDVQFLTKGKKSGSIILKPNENVVFYKESSRIEKEAGNKTFHLPEKIDMKPGKAEVYTKIKTELYTSWAGNRWIIEREPLTSLVPKLERRFNIKIIFSDPALESYKFTGIIENETIEQIMSALRFTAPIRYDIEKDTIHLHLDTKLKDRYTKIISH